VTSSHTHARHAALACLVLFAACQPQPAAEVQPGAAGADSLVLERTRCFGACPAYRLSLRADGTVTFTSRAPRDPSPVKTDAIPPSQFAWLVQQAQRIGLSSLPAVVADDKTLCPLRATDHPTVTVALFRADSTTQVIDYRGCYAATDLSAAPPLARRRHFEAQIDSVARSERWARAQAGASPP
jgi:hypothetical protein